MEESKLVDIVSTKRSSWRVAETGHELRKIINNSQWLTFINHLQARCNRHGAEGFHALAHVALQSPYKVDKISTPISQRRKLKHREIKLLAQNYTASSTTEPITHKPISLTPIVHFLPPSYAPAPQGAERNLDEGAHFIGFTGESGKAEPSRKDRL